MGLITIILINCSLLVIVQTTETSIVQFKSFRVLMYAAHWRLFGADVLYIFRFCLLT